MWSKLAADVDVPTARLLLGMGMSEYTALQYNII